MSFVSWAGRPDNEGMAIAPSHLPDAPKAGVTRRLRPTRRPRFERIGHRNSLATPSEVALRSAGVNHALR